MPPAQLRGWWGWFEGDIRVAGQPTKSLTDTGPAGVHRCRGSTGDTAGTTPPSFSPPALPCAAAVPLTRPGPPLSCPCSAPQPCSWPGCLIPLGSFGWRRYCRTRWRGCQQPEAVRARRWWAGGEQSRRGHTRSPPCPPSQHGGAGLRSRPARQRWPGISPQVGSFALPAVFPHWQHSHYRQIAVFVRDRMSMTPAPEIPGTGVAAIAAARRLASSIHPAKSSSGLGSPAPRRGLGSRTCWSVRCRTQAVPRRWAAPDAARRVVAGAVVTVVPTGGVRR